MQTEKVKIGKHVHPEKLKGTSLKDFLLNAKTIAKSSKALAPFKGKKAKCWVCGSSNSKDAMSVYGIKFVQCQNCTHIYQKHIIPDEVIYKFFKKDKKINCHLPRKQFDYRAKYVSKPKVDEVMKLRKTRKMSFKNGNWLDIGCGVGDLLYYVKNKYGWDVVGIDINKPGIKITTKHGITAYQSDIFDYYESINRGKKYFDVVSAMGYFDLVTSPVKHLEAVRKLLRPHGMLVINQPRSNSFTIDLIRTVPDKALRHCNALQRSIFTDKSMKSFLENNGFKIIFDWRFGLDFYTYISIVTMKIPELEKSKINKFFVEHDNKFQKIIDNHGYNDTLFYVAQLK
jgi:2-polyprenyl-3-methyl-5-hydroxy-6-metoxy-1,4-benzoquinol methylase